MPYDVIGFMTKRDEIKNELSQLLNSPEKKQRFGALNQSIGMLSSILIFHTQMNENGEQGKYDSSAFNLIRSTYLSTLKESEKILKNEDDQDELGLQIRSFIRKWKPVFVPPTRTLSHTSSPSI